MPALVPKAVVPMAALLMAVLLMAVPTAIKVGPCHSSTRGWGAMFPGTCFRVMGWWEHQG